MWWNVHLVSHMIDYAQKRRTAGCCCVVSCILLLFTLWQLLVSWWHCVEPCLRGVWCTFMFLFFCCCFFFFFLCKLTVTVKLLNTQSLNASSPHVQVRNGSCAKMLTRLREASRWKPSSEKESPSGRPSELNLQPVGAHQCDFTHL